MVMDGLGQEVERRDSKGAIILQAYDETARPNFLWARDQETAPEGQIMPITLRQRLIYGDDVSENKTENNLLGKLFKHYDEAGLQTYLSYDFKGNLLQKSRQIIKDERIVETMGGEHMSHFVVDWSFTNEETLEDRENFYLTAEQDYQTDMTYDALNRVVKMIYPEDVEGRRRWTRPYYNRAGALERLHLYQAEAEEPETYVQQIAYNAKGQRTFIAYGNHRMTRYAYDPQTFRLKRLRTEWYRSEVESRLNPDGGIIQDFAYQYDLSGNILSITHREPNSGVGGTGSLTRQFAYDPLYRLISAIGREQNNPIANPECPWLENLLPFNSDQGVYQYPEVHATLCI